MKRDRIYPVVQFAALVLAGFVLIGLSVRNVSYRELWDQISGANYWIAVPVYLVSLSGYFFRIERWRMFYTSMDIHPRRSMLFVALCTGYLVNFAVPRLGEISRCLILRKSDAVPVGRSVVTIVAERTL